MIILGLWAKYDIGGHYSRLVARILTNPLQILVNLEKKCPKQIVPIFIYVSHLLLGKDLQGFVRLGRGSARIHETFGEDSQGFIRLWERICKTLGEDPQGFMRLWERIHEDSRDFGRGFTRPWERICETLGEDSRGFVRLCKSS